MTVDLTQVELALYNLILTSVTAAMPQPFVQTSRRPSIYTNVDPSQQPFFAMCPISGTFNNGQAAGLTVLKTTYFVQILTRADSTTYDPVTQVAPQDALNAALKAILSGFLQSGGRKQTLNGLVIETLCEEYKIDAGILDQQCALELLVSVKIPINGN